MSESHYWPLSGEIGVYDIDHDSGAVWKEAMWTGDGWVAKGKMAPPISQTEAIAMGYRGVRRETPAKPDLNAIIREAIAEFRRDVKQPTKAADWAFKWASKFIEAVES